MNVLLNVTFATAAGFDFYVSSYHLVILEVLFLLYSHQTQTTLLGD